MYQKKFAERIKRTLAGILAAGMVLTGMPCLDVKAVNETPGQTQTEPEGSIPENLSENTVEEPEDTNPGNDLPDEGTGESDEAKPEDRETEPEEEVPEEEPTEDEDGLDTVYNTQISDNDISGSNVSDSDVSGSDISGNDLEAGEPQEEQEDEERRIVGGYIELPEDRDVSVVDESARIYDYEDEIAPLMSDSLPSQYAPDPGTLPLTRNQNPYGSCWAHSAMALAEMDMMKNGGAPSDADYSELHLAYFSYNGPVSDPLGGLDGDANYCTGNTFMDRGGNLSLARHVLANWVGAADESTAPYSGAESAIANGLSKDIAFADVAHLQNAFKINLQENPNIAKRMILRYGGVGTSYYDTKSYYNNTYKSYYCNTENTTNHAVTIVGWDDSFSADNFNTKPEAAGAWLIRNSWSAGNDTDEKGRDTYFWMSYYDKSLAAGYAFDFEDADNYHHNYQYDGSMQARSYSSSRNSVYLANVFTARAYEEGERLEAVGIDFVKAQTPYTITIYKNLTDSTNPESGVLIEEATTSGTCACEGFYTIPLKNSVNLAKDDTFSVVVQCGAAESEPDTVRWSCEGSADTWYRCEAAAKEGQSFYKLSNTWKDWGTEYKTNLRIKAYTMDDDGGTGLPTKIELKDELKEGVGIGVGDSCQASCTVLPRSASDRSVRWESDTPSVASVDENGLVTGVSDGTAMITVTCAAAGAESVKASFFVEVYSELRNIRITGAASVKTGKTITLRTVRSPSSVDAANVQWSSSDERVLTVDADGVVTGIAPGYASITARIGEVADTKKITCEFPTFSWNYHTSIEGLELTWPGNPDVKSYQIYRAKGASWTNPELLSTLTGTDQDTCSYLDANVTGGSQYIYEIRAVVNYIKGDGVEEKTVSSSRYKVTMPAYYTITYHLNGGQNSSDNPTAYRAGYSYSQIFDPERRPGYNFTGWYCDENLTRLLETSEYGYLPSDITGNLDLYAGWEPIVYQITYQLNDGTNPSEQITSYTVETDTSALLEATREGYVFGGWFTDAAFTDPITEIAKGSTGNKKLYAKWSIRNYRITYILYDGTNNAENPGTYNIKSDTIILKDAAKEKNTFEGWYSDPAYQQKVTQITTEDMRDITLYAKWRAIKLLEDGVLTMQAASFPYTGAEQKPPVTLTVNGDLLVEGRDYTVDYLDNKNAGKATVIARGIGDYQGSISHTFMITPAKLVIRALDKTIFTGEKIPEESDYEYEVSGLLADDRLVKAPLFKCDVTETDTQKAGRFTITPSDADAGPNYTITSYENGWLTVESKYLVYSVTFDMQGHGTAPEPLHDIREGSTINEPEKPENESEEGSYIFKGWYKDAACTQYWNFDSDIVQSDMTLYAKWVEKSPQTGSQFVLQEIEEIYYNGKAWKPAVNVYNGKNLLKSGRDYTVKYFNNINANADGVWKKGSGQGADFNPNIPYVQITGKGNYTDEIKMNFDIKPAEIADGEGNPEEKVVLKYTDQFVTADKELKPFRSIKYSKTMKPNQDYTLELIAEDVRDNSGKNVPKGSVFTDAAVPQGYTGRFTLIVTGIGNYHGSIEKTVYVTDKDHLMKNAKITLGKNQKNVELVGESVELTPSTQNSANTFTVKLGTRILTPKEDYEISYLKESNRMAGKATLVVTGVGTYSGTKTASFTVKGKPFTAGTITVTGIENRIYTGKEITQNNVVLIYNAGKADEKKLKYGDDYTISYAKNINKGTATMTFAGAKERGFSGSFKKNFRISAAVITKENLEDGWNTITAEYSKTGAEPAAKIVLTNADGKRLQNGKDYTLSYKNNKRVAGANDENAPTIIVKGKGNYQGTISIPFTITGADLRSKIASGEITVKATAVAYQPTKSDAYVYKPAIKLMEGNKTLRSGADYTVTYMYNTQAEYKAYIKGNGTAGSSAPAPQAVITAGTGNTYLVKPAAGQTDISGISVPLTIYRNKLTKKNIRVKISECAYTGSQVKPDMVVSYKGENGWIDLTKKKDYTVSYGTNVKSGKKAGRVTISGIGTLYGGDVTVNFEILPQKIGY